MANKTQQVTAAQTEDEHYLLDHGIPLLFDRMIQDLLSVKPKDTILWMVDWFQSQEDVMEAYHTQHAAARYHQEQHAAAAAAQKAAPLGPKE